jgi:NADH:ubiquinone oxidoreductase subunit 3 (subunit A)
MPCADRAHTEKKDSPMPATWAAVIVYLAIAASVGAVMLLGSRLLRVRSKHRPDTAVMTYECGEEPTGRAWMRFHPRYYVVALVFVLFDVEVIFLVPWAVNSRSLGGFAVVEMIVFAAILLLGWVYALRKGALSWR